MKLINSLRDTESHGTHIIGFDYDGVRRNAILNTRACDAPVKGEVERAARSVILDHKGTARLVARVMNDPQPIKTFFLDKIENVTNL